MLMPLVTTGTADLIASRLPDVAPVGLRLRHEDRAGDDLEGRPHVSQRSPEALAASSAELDSGLGEPGGVARARTGQHALDAETGWVRSRVGTAARSG